MALITIAGSPVLSGRLTMPLRGPWTFDGKVDVDTLPSGSVSLSCTDGLSLQGTVDPARSGIVLDSAHLWLVGGAGGLGKPVSGAFRSAELRDPLDAIMQASGETLSSTVDAGLLSTLVSRWSIGTATASAALSSLAAYATGIVGQPVNWRVLSDGTIWIGIETWPAASLADMDAIAMIYPAQSKTVISVATPTIGPAVTIDGIGRVAAVEHWINPAQGVETWLYTDTSAASAADLFRRNARAAVGLNPDPESFPRLDRMALYPARVDAAAADGSTVDVTPTNTDIEPQMGLPLRTPPGTLAIPKTGTIVRVGWDEGNPSKMYATPICDAGSSLSKLVLNADVIYLVAESGSQFVALANKVNSELNKIALAFSTFVPGSGGASFPNAYTSATDVGADHTKAK